MDATLLELTGLVREVNFEARRRGTRFSFAQVFIIYSQRLRTRITVVATVFLCYINCVVTKTKSLHPGVPGVT